MSGSGTAFPKTVLAACCMWMLHGLHLLIGLVSSIAQNGVVLYPNILLGGAFVLTGVLVLAGKIERLNGPAVLCLIAGGLQLLSFAVLFGGHEQVGVAGWRMAIVVVSGLGLAAAGVLALIGNAAYRHWQSGRSMRSSSSPRTVNQAS